MRLPLIDGHGNFGSLDSGPAAMRYTESRLAPSAMMMVDESDEDTVDFGPNYDGQILEPQVLPAAFPNLLVNGATGIAVGMATNMAPHNLAEVISAAKHLMENPKATLKQLMKIVPGPDFPTGGYLVATEGIADAYANGRGSFKVRATAVIEKVSARKQGIVITELPYNIGLEKVIPNKMPLLKANKIDQPKGKLIGGPVEKGDWEGPAVMAYVVRTFISALRPVLRASRRMLTMSYRCTSGTLALTSMAGKTLSN